LSAYQIEDLKLASSKMSGAERRAFQAAMTLKYCQGNARLAERVLGWGRETVQLGLNEHRTGIICRGMQSTYGGDKLWEEKHPEVARALWTLAQAHSQQDPTFRTLLSYTRLTAAEALKQLRSQGFREDQLPSPSTMAEILNPNGYRLRKVVKAKPQKKLPETDAIFANIKEKDGAILEEGDSVDGRLVKRLSIDCKATVNIGDYSRGGKIRGDSRAADHDMGCEEKYVPFGIVDEDEGTLYLTFGSSFKTSDFIADSLMSWWENTATHEGLLSHISRSRSTTAQRAVVCARSSLSALSNSSTILEKSSNCCTIRLTTASTIRLTAAGTFWSSTGMEPSW
jgi:hypothetical protein